MRDLGAPDGETRTRTGDTTIFSRVLYQLSYLAAGQKASGSSHEGATDDDAARVEGGCEVPTGHRPRR